MTARQYTRVGAQPGGVDSDSGHGYGQPVRNALLGSVWLAVVVCAVAACAPAAPAATPSAGPPPPVTVPSANPTPPSASTPSPSSSPPPEPAQPAASVPAPASDPCRGSSFDLDHLPNGCYGSGQRGVTPASALTARVEPDAPKVRSGHTVGVTVTFTNRTSGDAVLRFQPRCMEFDVGAYSKGKRADYIDKDCGYGSGCGGPEVRVVVEAGGRLVRHLKFSARVRRVSSKNDCSEVDAGGLRPGRYDLEVTAGPFFPLASALEKAQGKLRIVR